MSKEALPNMQPKRLIPELVSGPATEPLSLSEAKAQLSIASSDTSHDAVVASLISEAREQWEHDTSTVTCHQTVKVITDMMDDEVYLPRRPIASITHIKYYDTNNVLQTLSPTIYQLDKGRRSVRLAYDKDYPVTAVRWDAWQITYVCGYSADGALVPAIAKRAMLLLVGHYFENRDMLVPPSAMSFMPYESLVARFTRSNYP